MQIFTFGLHCTYSDLTSNRKVFLGHNLGGGGSWGAAVTTSVPTHHSHYPAHTHTHDRKRFLHILVKTSQTLGKQRWFGETMSGEYVKDVFACAWVCVSFLSVFVLVRSTQGWKSPHTMPNRASKNASAVPSLCLSPSCFVFHLSLTAYPLSS